MNNNKKSKKNKVKAIANPYKYIIETLIFVYDNCNVLNPKTIRKCLRLVIRHLENLQK